MHYVGKYSAARLTQPPSRRLGAGRPAPFRCIGARDARPTSLDTRRRARRPRAACWPPATTSRARSSPRSGSSTRCATAAARVDPALAAVARARSARRSPPTAAEELLVDYTRLFLGPVDALAQPYGSVWLGADELADAGLDDGGAAATTRTAGFEVDEDFRDLPDHVAAELEFLYLLLFREAERARAATRRRARAIGLLRQRLPRRAPRGAGSGRSPRRCARAPQCAFYRELADLTERFVTMETARGSER
ncbi:MAG: molecular chaperone TorD family protein [Comamonadaceae bacterium]|nr:molecular chaperone TorD family protein [Comamonadaceae bacterium]